jgi:hypothetical protein
LWSAIGDAFTAQQVFLMSKCFVESMFWLQENLFEAEQPAAPDELR